MESSGNTTDDQFDRNPANSHSDDENLTNTEDEDLTNTEDENLTSTEDESTDDENAESANEEDDMVFADHKSGNSWERNNRQVPGSLAIQETDIDDDKPPARNKRPRPQYHQPTCLPRQPPLYLPRPQLSCLGQHPSLPQQPEQYQIQRRPIQQHHVQQRQSFGQWQQLGHPLEHDALSPGNAALQYPPRLQYFSQSQYPPQSRYPPQSQYPSQPSPFHSQYIPPLQHPPSPPRHFRTMFTQRQHGSPLTNGSDDELVTDGPISHKVPPPIRAAFPRVTEPCDIADLSNPANYYSLRLGSLPSVETCLQLRGHAALLAQIPFREIEQSRSLYKHFFRIEEFESEPGHIETRGICHMLQCIHGTFSLGTSRTSWARHAINKHTDVCDALLMFRLRQKNFLLATAPQTGTASQNTRRPAKKAQQELVFKIAAMIAIERLSLSFVESKSFRGVVHFANPNLKVPSVIKFEEILQDYQIHKRVDLKDCLSAVQFGSITSDIWTSKQGNKYLGLTFHFIRHHDFQPQSIAIGMEPLNDSHTAVLLKTTITHNMTRWDSKYNTASRMLALLPAVDHVIQSAEVGQSKKDESLLELLQPHILDRNEKTILKEGLGILKPVYDLTHFFNADNHSSISVVYTSVHDLISRPVTATTAEAQGFSTRLVKELVDRWNMDYIPDLDLISAFLNPSFVHHNLFRRSNPNDLTETLGDQMKCLVKKALLGLSTLGVMSAYGEDKPRTRSKDSWVRILDFQIKEYEHAASCLPDEERRHYFDKPEDF
ncbi:hypothetical protein BGZ80_011415 [Entomortierella chlamydospora]|uniref:Uncharacterized protein n=1 Tax=Entomortierella chlamydospora TaxID=101097 RepID=A0A9P6SZ21_9FUNG|nr:hypothetical protein BGZ80_011415 [Entomortierella chlamydospora]